MSDFLRKYYRKENPNALFGASVSQCGQWAVTRMCPFQSGINVLIASNCFGFNGYSNIFSAACLIASLILSKHLLSMVQGHGRMLTDSSRSE